MWCDAGPSANSCHEVDLVRREDMPKRVEQVEEDHGSKPCQREQRITTTSSRKITGRNDARTESHDDVKQTGVEALYERSQPDDVHDIIDLH